MALTLRLATEHDVPELARLYAQTARALGHWCYSAEQVTAWASFGDDLAAFRGYVLDAETWIAQAEDGRAVGFCGVGPTGEVHSLYVRHDGGRQGIGSMLLAHALETAGARGVTRFVAWATPFSRPLFGRHGFELVQTVQGDFQGVAFERYRMAR